MTTPRDTIYSKKIAGDAGNYNLPVFLDKIGGYVGISQPRSSGVIDRVLLSPKQVKAFVEFIKRRVR